MSNEVTDLLDALYEGTMTLDEVARRFRERRWPRRRRASATSYAELAAAELQDPDPYLSGSFDDVVLAYDLKKITRDQFRMLSSAVAEAQRAEDADEGKPEK